VCDECKMEDSGFSPLMVKPCGLSDGLENEGDALLLLLIVSGVVAWMVSSAPTVSPPTLCAFNHT